MTYTIAALYKFTPLEDIPALRQKIQDQGKELESLCGTLLLAPEGINGTIGAHEAELKQIMDFLRDTINLEGAEIKYSHSENRPFNRFKVRPKKEIITMKCPEADPNVQVGTYVSPEEWNEIIADPDVTVIDTRNIYETRVGTFKHAIDPDLEVFSEFPEWVEDNLNPKNNKKIAMFCTGGIRCEKASSYMLAKGFDTVYHLEGGILKYLETIPENKSLWEGDCFVFDNRVSVTHGLKEGEYTICHGCREPLSKEDMEHKAYKPGISCLHCVDTVTPERLKTLQDRHAHYEKIGVAKAN